MFHQGRSNRATAGAGCQYAVTNYLQAMAENPRQARHSGTSVVGRGVDEASKVVFVFIRGCFDLAFRLEPHPRPSAKSAVAFAFHDFALSVSSVFVRGCFWLVKKKAPCEQGAPTMSDSLWPSRWRSLPACTRPSAHPLRTYTCLAWSSHTSGCLPCDTRRYRC